MTVTTLALTCLLKEHVLFVLDKAAVDLVHWYASAPCANEIILIRCVLIPERRKIKKCDAIL
jgi:hypothetical protein